jgi:nucleoside-specific outer membrane channel protein Tsx
MMRDIRSPIFLIVALATPVYSSHVFAEDYTNTNVQVFYTNRAKVDRVMGTGTENEKLTSFKLEHYGTFTYGDHYFFADNYHGREVGGRNSGSFGAAPENHQYIVYMPRMSLGKVFERSLAIGPIADVALAARFEYGSYGSYRAKAFGPSLDLKLPGFDFVTTRLLWQTTNFEDRQFFVHTAWGSKIKVGSRKLHFDGYFWTKKNDSGGRQWFAEPEVTVDIDEVGKVQGGMRVTYSRYRDYSRTSPQVLLKLNF